MGALGHQYGEFLRGCPLTWLKEQEARVRHSYHAQGKEPPGSAPIPKTAAEKSTDRDHLRRVAAEYGLRASGETR